MFGKNAWVDKMRERLTAYVDERFEEYRDRLANDLSKGLATLAGIVTIWTIAVLCLVFLGIVLALLFSTLLKGWLGSWAYLVGFLVITGIYAAVGSWFIRNRVKYVEAPVFKAMLKSLGGEEHAIEDDTEETTAITIEKTAEEATSTNSSKSSKTKN